MVDKFVRTVLNRNCLWVLLLVFSFSSGSDSSINCLRNLKSQFKDPNGHLSNWEIPKNSLEAEICNFNGVICVLSGVSMLNINLGGIGLEGELPSGFKDCPSLTSLILSGNRLSGTLPSDLFSFLPYLVTLDLSHNNFSGGIPATLSNIAYLNTLLLDHNRFTGNIPPALALSPRLKQFSVADNHLQGPIPIFITGYIPLWSVEDNLDLCGFPLDPCPDSSDSFYSMAIKAAIIASATFFPVGAAFGWFCFANKQK